MIEPDKNIIFERVPVVVEDDYIIKLQPHISEEGTHMMFIHCDVTSKWTKLIKEDLKFKFKKLAKKMKTPLYANCKVDDYEHQKFLKMFDFKPQSLVQSPQSMDVCILYKHNALGVH